MSEDRGEADAAGDARTRILDAAEPLFRQMGFARTTMDGIAAGARMSKRTLYIEFPDKRTILEAVLDHFIAGRFAAIADFSTGLADDRRALIVIAQGLRDAALDAPAMAMYRLLIGEARHLPTLAERANRTGLAESVRLMRGPLERQGVADPVMAGRMIYDLAVLAPLHRRMMDFAEADLAVEAIVQVVLSGLAGPGVETHP